MAQAIERMAVLWALAGGLFLLAIMAVTTTNAGAFALDRVAGLWGGGVTGLPGYEDFVRLAVGCAAAMFLPLCQHRRGHVSVDLFTRAMPPRWRQRLEQASLWATALLALFLAFWMAVGLAETRADNGLSPILGWPEWPFFVPGVLSLIFWAGIAAYQALETRARA
ncbi:MAG: TRAP transporter small permease [Pseudomonadota bacterium]